MRRMDGKSDHVGRAPNNWGGTGLRSTNVRSSPVAKLPVAVLVLVLLLGIPTRAWATAEPGWCEAFPCSSACPDTRCNPSKCPTAVCNEQCTGIYDPCDDVCGGICNPDCVDYAPCDASCGGVCNQACPDYDPCDSACGGPCNPECQDHDPCHPWCGGICNPACGTYDPCAPECGGDCKFQCQAPPGPPPCETECDTCRVDCADPIAIEVNPPFIFPGCTATVTICTGESYSGPQEVQVRLKENGGCFLSGVAGDDVCDISGVSQPCNSDYPGHCLPRTLNASQTYTLFYQGMDRREVLSHPEVYVNPSIPHAGDLAHVIEADLDPTEPGLQNPPRYRLDCNINDLDDPAEEDPGIYIGVNDDFDEGKATEDREDPDPFGTPCESFPFAQIDNDYQELGVGICDYRYAEPEFVKRVSMVLSDRGGGGPEGDLIRVISVNPECDSSPCSNCYAVIGEDENIGPNYLFDGPREDWEFFAEGLAPGVMELDLNASLYVNPGCAMTDVLRINVVRVDADVDSDNDGTIDESQEEDRIEERNGEVGAVIVLNNDDDDGDHFVDWADGFDWADGIDGRPDKTDDDQNANEDDFLELKVKLEGPVDPDVAYLRVNYLASDPTDCSPSGGSPPTTTKPAGPALLSPLRIWRKPGNEVRNKTSALAGDEPGDGGDWIAPGEYKQLERLTGGSASSTITLYVEGVHPTTVAPAQIWFELDPDGPGTLAGYIHTDIVQVSVVPVDLDVDTNRENGIVDDESDDMGEDQWTMQHGAIVLYNCDDDNQVTGTADAIAAGSLTDGAMHWEPGQWAGGHVVITSPDKWKGYRADVTANTGTELSLSAWRPGLPSPPPPATPPIRNYKVFDGVDAETADWVDGPNDRLDMAEVEIRPMGQLSSGFSVMLRAFNGATPDASAMRVWADEDLDDDRTLDTDPHEDFDGDGHLDTEEDENHNGVLDPGEDLNANGRLDYIGAVVVGEGLVVERDITALAQDGGTVYLEALSFPVATRNPMEFDLELELRRPGGAVVATDRVRLRAAPWLMISHAEPAQEVLVVHGNGNLFAPIENTSFVTALEAHSPVPVRRINGAAYDDPPRLPPLPPVRLTDPWIQDEIEIGYTEAPYHEFHVVLDSPRNGALADFAQFELLGNDVGWYNCPTAGGPAHTTSSFGNLEVSPPVSALGSVFKLGRIVHGTLVDTGISGFLDAQYNVQSRVGVNTTFLAVEHIDEIFSFIPRGGSQGFRVAVASPVRAQEIMVAVQAEGYGQSPLASPGTDPDLAWIDDLLALGAPAWINVAYNTAMEGLISGSRTTLQTQLGLTFATDYIWMPVWFYDASGSATPVNAVAYSADMVNGLLANEWTFIAPHPFGPADGGGYPRFATELNQTFLALGLSTPRYADDWHWYHLAHGEVHCGTNSFRTIPSEHWWASP